MVEYDRVKAIEYARKWALSANSQYYHFGGIGGDCTNFISQCLKAGGGVENFNYLKGWYYNSIADRSPSWTSVSYLQAFLLRENESVGPKAKICRLNEVEVGDIIQLRQNNAHFNHTVIVSKIDKGRIYVCAHSNDAQDKALDSYNFFDLMPLHIMGIIV